MTTRTRNTNRTTTVETENGTSVELKRTTYKSVINLTEMVNGVETRVYGEESRRAYGEGPGVATINSVRDRVEALGRAYDDDMVESPFVNKIEIDETHNLYVGVIAFEAVQCGVCGAQRGAEHSWCPGCQGEVIELDPMALLAAAKGKK